MRFRDHIRRGAETTLSVVGGTAISIVVGVAAGVAVGSVTTVGFLKITFQEIAKERAEFERKALRNDAQKRMDLDLLRSRGEL